MIDFSIFFPENIIVKRVTVEHSNISFELISSKPYCRCPYCNKASRRIHSEYTRTLSDLPVFQKKIVIYLQTRKFFCDNNKCERKIFTERYESLIVPYARKTDRLISMIEKVSFATSAEIGAKILKAHITDISPDTLIRTINNTKIIIYTDYECIGIDDWAFKKGSRYGTLICDLKTHKPISVLANRDYETLKNWLAEKGEIKFCSRDRAVTYAAAIKDALPKVEHIADRFHLVNNIGQVIIDYLKRKHTNGIVLKEPLITTNLKKKSGYWERLRKEQEQRYHNKWELIKQVREMYTVVPNKTHLARHFSLSWKTVNTYLKTNEPPKPTTRFRISILDDFKGKVVELTKAGMSVTDILKAIKEEGYIGSYRTVQNFIKNFRDKKYGEYSGENLGYKSKRVPRKRLMALLFKFPEDLEEKQQKEIKEK